MFAGMGKAFSRDFTLACLFVRFPILGDLARFRKDHGGTSFKKFRRLKRAYVRDGKLHEPSRAISSYCFLPNVLIKTYL